MDQAKQTHQYLLTFLLMGALALHPSYIYGAELPGDLSFGMTISERSAIF